MKTLDTQKEEEIKRYPVVTFDPFRSVPQQIMSKSSPMFSRHVAMTRFPS